MKNIVAREVLLSYPNFREKFITHTEASKSQLGGVISQNRKPITFCSIKLTPAQINYKNTEREMLITAEALKDLRTIILVHRITLYMDHKNLKSENSTTEIVPRWSLMLGENRPEIKYIKDPDNGTEDSLIRLTIINSDIIESDVTRKTFAGSYCVDQFDFDKFPLRYQTINKYQRKDKNIVEI